MKQGACDEILLIAPALLGESLALKLQTFDSNIKIFLSKEKLTKHPSLVIWSLESIEAPSSIQYEIRRLEEIWDPTPILLLIPSKLRVNSNELLEFNCPGLLQDPDINTLFQAIEILKGGGRILRLREDPQEELLETPTLGMGQWLLVSGIQQINNDLRIIDFTLKENQESFLSTLILLGRKRELINAKKLLNLLWGPVEISITNLEFISNEKPQNQIYPNTRKSNTSLPTLISLKERNSIAVWSIVRERIENSIGDNLGNLTGSILAIDGLNHLRKKDLLFALTNQLELLLTKIRNSKEDTISIENSWNSLQTELRQEAIRAMVGNYIRLPLEGERKSVSEKIIEMSDLEIQDDELPESKQMIDHLIINKPVLVGNQILPIDDPRSIMQLEILFSNWIIRTADLIASEILEVCANWPELRTYILHSNLISTRELERLRNQLNSQTRWNNFIERPIQLYESKRLFYKIDNGNIKSLLMNELRDEELRNLGWWQKQVALIIETKDALAPQLQSLVKRLGDVMVVLLTQIIGKSIGLVGKGIAQGMGRNLRRG